MVLAVPGVRQSMLATGHGRHQLMAGIRRTCHLSPRHSADDARHGQGDMGMQAGREHP